MKKKVVSKKKINFGIQYIIDLFCITRIYKFSKKYQHERGHKMAIFANDHIGICINQLGIYEREELEYLSDFLSSVRGTLLNGIVLDIGANIGNHSLYFSDLFKEVISFEPHPDTYKLLEFNTSFRTNIRTHNFGLGDARETVALHENPTNLGGSSIESESDNHNNSLEISLQKLDDFVNDLQRIDLIKMDVEGYESKVIIGGKNTIKKHQPIILFEQYAEEFCNGTTETIKLLKAHGYQFCWIENKLSSTTFIGRRIINIFEILFGRNISILVGDDVPVKFHSMLIAIPKRFSRDLLGTAH